LICQIPPADHIYHIHTCGCYCLITMWSRILVSKNYAFSKLTRQIVINDSILAAFTKSQAKIFRIWCAYYFNLIFFTLLLKCCLIAVCMINNIFCDSFRKYECTFFMRKVYSASVIFFYDYKSLTFEIRSRLVWCNLDLFIFHSFVILFILSRNT